jgi:hypothetical protein
MVTCQLYLNSEYSGSPGLTGHARKATCLSSQNIPNKLFDYFHFYVMDMSN